MDVRYTPEGLHLPAIDLWLDPSEPRPAAFISHAHADHLGGVHGLTFCSLSSADLLGLRGANVDQLQPLAWGESIEYRGARLTLFPAGHILGAAQLLVEHGGERFVYTGDFKLAPPLCADAATIVPCDHLVIESTFGLPIFRFLTADEARARIVAAARRALDDSLSPVFLGYPLGRSQEIVDVLSTAGVPVAVHGATAKYLDTYRKHVGRPFACVPYERGITGHAIVGPPNFGRQLGAASSKFHVVAVSGWALLDNARQRYGADELIAYSDHADFDELLRVVDGSGAKRIDVVHGFAEAFSSILRARGFDARAPKEAAAPVDQEEAAP